MDNKTYLGDGVYASFDGYQVWVWASDGEYNTAKIALEPGVIDRLNAFYKEKTGVKFYDRVGGGGGDGE